MVTRHSFRVGNMQIQYQQRRVSRLIDIETISFVLSNFMICMYVYMSFCKRISFIYLSISCIERVVGGSIPLTNIWRESDM